MQISFHRLSECPKRTVVHLLYLSADAALVKLLEIYRRTEVAEAHTYSFPARTDPLAEGQFPLSSSHVVVPSGPFPAVF